MSGSIYFHVPGKLSVRNVEISWFHTFSSEQCWRRTSSFPFLARNFFRVPTRLPGFNVFLELCFVQIWLVSSYNPIRLFWRTYKPQLTNSSSLDLSSPFHFFAETHLIVLFPMSSDENTPVGQKRPGALQLGPRKKLYVHVFAPQTKWFWLWRSAVRQTRSYIMDGTLGAPSMLYAMSLPF